MTAPLISCENISKAHGSQVLFENLSLGIMPGDHIGIIGPNGAGKSTLIKILAQVENPNDGKVVYKRGVRIGYVPQMSSYPDQAIFDILNDSFADDHHVPSHEKETKIQILLSKMGFKDFYRSAQTLSGGWKKRLDIAKELIKEPDVLLLDEPTNHLDLESILWLENFLPNQSFSYAIISHDRIFLENVTNRVMEINKRFPKGLFTIEGSYNRFVEQRALFLEGQLEYQRSLASKVRGEVEWLRKTPQARTTKAQSRIQQAERLQQEFAEIKGRNKQQKSQIDFVDTERFTQKLVTAKNLSKTRGERKLFEKLDFTLSPGMKVGLVGPNGSGKSTLLKIVMRELTADVGTVKYADGVKIAYFDQHKTHLPPNIPLREALSPQSDTVNYRGQHIHVNSWSKRFLFHPDKLDLPVSQLSGGEKARVLIARFMLEPADILLLDEPTNDLDIETLEVLEESLAEFSGAFILVTHDRCMLENVCNTFIGVGAGDDHHHFADYQQWQKQEKSYKEKQQAATKAERTESASPKKEKDPSPSSKKLSYKERVELEKMEEKILQVEETISLLEAEVEKGLPDHMQKLCEELHQAQEHKDLLYARWQELLDKNA